MRIYVNPVQPIDKRSDRVLVFWGAGHLGWRQTDVRMDHNPCLRTVADFAPKQ
jgi:hypothetical protein